MFIIDERYSKIFFKFETDKSNLQVAHNNKYFAFRRKCRLLPLSNKVSIEVVWVIKLLWMISMLAIFV